MLPTSSGFGVSPMSINRYLIVGLGSIGRRHLANLHQLRPGCEVAVLRRSAAPDEAVDSGFRTITTMDEVDDFAPHAAIVAGPASTHLDVALPLVKRGISVLVEKPLSHSIDGISDLQAAAGAAQATVMVGYNLRFDSSLIAAREAVLSDLIGQVRWARAEVGQYLPDWRPGSDYRQGVSAQRALGGGALLELSHEIDFIYWMFGCPDRVTARGGTVSDLEIDVEDCIDLILEYRSPRRVVTIHLDFLQRAPSRAAKFVGSNGTILWDGIDQMVTMVGSDGARKQVYAPEAGADRNAMYLREITCFLDVVEGSGEVPIGLDQGRDVMAIIDAAQRSLVSGCAEALSDMKV
jgi:predicted dehydrogenase